jgi:hypothetical protein
LLDFHEIWWAGDAIEGGINAILFNPLALTIKKVEVQSCEVDTLPAPFSLA